MTSNIGFEQSSLGFTNKNKDNINTSLTNSFSKSLINRIDNIVIFNNLTKDNITKIIINKLNKLQEKYKDFTYNNKLIEEIIEESNYKEYGARKINKIIESKLENIIIDKIINDESLNITSIKQYLTI